MDDRRPRLDDATLAQLRQAMEDVAAGRSRHVAAARISEALPAGYAATVDFTAERILGQPLVVLRERRELPPCFEGLSPREREVAGLVAAGLRNKDIGLALGISVATVKDHVHRILAKSGLDSRAAVAANWC